MKIMGIAILAAGLASAGGWCRAEKMQIPLQQLTPLKSLELRCVSEQREIQVPIPERWKVASLVLHLRYTVSMNLLPDSSQLVVKLRDQPIAQLRLNPLQPDAQYGIDIPVALLEPGYNALSFFVAQHAARSGQCEAPCPPDLWTNIDLKGSYLEADYALKPLPASLAALSTHVFDPRLLPQGRVHIVTEDLEPRSATIAGIVASGIARRFDYRPVAFTVSRELVPGEDNVIAGSSAFAARMLQRYGYPARPMDGGYLRMLPMVAAGAERDPAHALVVVAGSDDNAARLAAVTFSNISFPLPGSDELKAFGFELPDVERYSGRESITPDRVYDFRTLDFPTQSFVGANPGSRQINFRLPPDFQIRPNQYAKLAISFSYGAGLRNDSSFNVAVNGHGIRAVALDAAGGGFVDGYKMDIPTYVFKPGANTLELTGHLHSPGQLCDLVQANGLFLTVFEVSTLSFPAMPHLVEMPKLELFMHSGFPLTRWPDGHEVSVWLAERSDAVLGATLNLIGLATQRNGFPLFGVAFTYDKPPKDGELLVVGRDEMIAPEIRAQAPLKLLGKDGSVPYPVVRGWSTEASAAVSRQQASLAPGRALLMQFESPYQAGRSVTLFTAAQAADLLEGSRSLLMPAVQAQAQGDLVLIEPGLREPKVSAMRSGPRYVTGKTGSYSEVQSFFYTRPAAYYAAVAVAIVVLALLVFLVLRRRRAARIRG